MAVLLSGEPSANELLAPAIGVPADVVRSVADLRDILVARPDEDLVVIGPDIDLALAFEVASSERILRPTLGVVLVRQRVDSGVLGQALRAGIRELVSADDLQGIAEASRRSLALTRQMRQASAGGGAGRPGTRSGHVVTVFSAKGGCGKTTVATNLGAALANNGERKVCIVDLDLAFGDVGVVMQLPPTRTITDLLSAGTVDEVLVTSTVVQHSAGLDVLLAPLEPGAAERIPATLVGSLLQELRSLYDFVIVDTPPAFTDHVLAAFDNTDYYLLLATLDVPALKNLKLALETLDILGYPRDRWRVVLNRADAKVGLSVEDVQRTLKSAIAVEIPSSRAVPASVNRGVPIVLESPGHDVSTAIKRLAADLATQVGEKATHRARGGALTFLRRGRAAAV